jgi:hypothetical protein
MAGGVVWTGWLWLAAPARWERVSAADTLAECSNQLGKIARERGIPDWHSCLTRGAAPTYQPITR